MFHFFAKLKLTRFELYEKVMSDQNITILLVPSLSVIKRVYEIKYKESEADGPTMQFKNVQKMRSCYFLISSRP